MSVIKLENLIIENFKNIKYLSLDFGNITNIYGENKLGKTTIFDGVTWLLFDKDSKDRSKFEVQPLDEGNNIIEMVETMVCGSLSIDGVNLELKKVLKQRWVKKKGEVKAEKKGTETLYYINELPVKLSEYKAKINSIIDEKLFKLITSPLYFSLNMKWEDRRKVILAIIGDITTDSVINYNPSLKPLLKLLKGTDLDTLKRTLWARIKKLKEDKTSIPYRVDELNKAINTEVDFEALAFRKTGIMAEMASVDEKLIDASKINESLVKEKNSMYDIRSKLSNIEFELNEKARQPLKQLKLDLRAAEEELYKVENQAYRAKNLLENDRNKAIEMETELQKLRDRHAVTRDEVLEIFEEEFCCPTCRRALEAEDIQVKKKQLTDNFNENKSRGLEKIKIEGKAKKELWERLQDEIKGNEVELATLNTKVAKLKLSTEEGQAAIDNFNPVVDLSQNVEYQKLKAEAKEVEIRVQAAEQDTLSRNSTESAAINQNKIQLKARKKGLELELGEVNSGLGFKEQNLKTKTRIDELSSEEKQLAEKIAELESEEFLCEKYVKTKVELLEAGINSKFKFVKFKWFDTLVNGAVEECCEALIDGVPFSNANTASQFNAGIDIINALSEYYKISAPVFIDNRESVNEILDCNSQVINLIVSKDKKLVVKNIDKSEVV